MKKFSFALCVILVFALMFSMSACEMENGVTIKYATLNLTYVNEDGDTKTEDIVIKLYTNYAPDTIERFVELAEDGFYNNTVVNNAESSWFTLGGYKMNGTELEEVTSGKENLYGEFAANGWSGNGLNITKGSVVMYRDFTNANTNNYNTANSKFAICTGTATPFTVTNYSVFGKIEDTADLKVLDEIIALRDKTEDSETLFNRYYVGGIDEIAKSFLNEDGTINEAKADDKNIEMEDIEKVVEGGEEYHTAGYISAEEYDDFVTVATKFINSINSNAAAYFYYVPWNTVTLNSVKISNKI